MHFEKPPARRPCEACKKPIMLIVSAKDPSTRIPVDADPITVERDDPKITLVHADGTTTKGARAGDSGFTPHWANCSDPNRFRKKRNKKERRGETRQSPGWQ
jgi:hypothetical protein